MLLLWVAFPFVFFWLPLVRSVMDGATYAWGVGWWGWRFGGAGLEGDLWYLVAGVALGTALLWSGARDGPFFRWVAPAWMLLLLVRASQAALSDPEGFVFHGDTLGVRLNLTWVAPTFHLVGVVLLALWLGGLGRGAPEIGSEPEARVGGSAGAARGRILLLAGLLPVQFFLLRFGEPHGTTDAAGVLITIGQWLAVPWAFRPVRRPQGGRGDR